MKIKLTKEEIQKYAELYDDPLSDRMKEAKSRGYMTLDDLIQVARWKWGGETERLCKMNTEDKVREISEASFKAKTDCERIKILLQLRGVGWPVASVILHFAYPEKYPILDIRVMRTVEGPTSKYYNCKIWNNYVKLCQNTAKVHNISIRELDKALWAYDWEEQKKMVRST